MYRICSSFVPTRRASKVSLTILGCLCRHKFTGIEATMHWVRPCSIDERMNESDTEQ